MGKSGSTRMNFGECGLQQACFGLARCDEKLHIDVKSLNGIRRCELSSARSTWDGNAVNDDGLPRTRRAPIDIVAVHGVSTKWRPD